MKTEIISKLAYLNDRTVDAFLKVPEPYAVKVASTVLRRERRGNPPDLSDRQSLYASLK